MATPPKLSYEEEHLTGLDIFWLRADSPENQIVTNCALCLEKNVGIDKVEQALARMVEAHPRFRSKAVQVGLGRYDWVQQPDFSPKKYGCVEEIRLAEPTQAALTRFYEDASSTLL
eukprot:RCo029067